MLLRAVLLTLALAPSSALRPSFQAPPLAQTPVSHPRLCAGNLDTGAHTATVELMVAGSSDEGGSSTRSWSHFLAGHLGPLGGLLGPSHANALSLSLPAGTYKGFTSSQPGVGFILVLWDNDEEEEEERDISTSAFGMAIMQTANTTCHDIFAWTASGVLTPGVCLTHALPPDFTPSLHCVGEGTLWNSAPEELDLFEGFPVMDFTSTPDSACPCSIRKRVSAATGYAIQEWGTTPGGTVWTTSLVGASTNPSDGDFELPAQCAAAAQRAAARVCPPL